MRLESWRTRFETAKVHEAMTPTLVLWDIDGTLLRGGGVGKRAMEAAFREVVAAATLFDLASVPFHGEGLSPGQA